MQSLLDLYNMREGKQPGSDLLEFYQGNGQAPESEPDIPGWLTPLRLKTYTDYMQNQFEQGDNSDLLTGVPQTAAMVMAARDPLGTATNALSSAYDFLLRPAVEGAQRSLVAQEGPPIFDDGGQYVSGAVMQPLDPFNAASLGPVGGVVGRATGAIPRGALGSGGSDMLSGAKGIRAYHGSPHDFEKFDIGKIGTGEGAQAYGHGLYFADSPAVADSYREGLSFGNGDTTITLGGKKLDRSDPLWETGLNAPPEQTIGQNVDYWKKQSEYWPDRFGHLIDATSAYPPNSTFRRGRMYEVNINAQPEQFLDWAKSLDQQSPFVQNAVNRIGERLPPHQRPFATQAGKSTYANLADAADIPSEHAAAPLLREAGVPGIRYLDASSRGAEGPGTYNYVVFDDALIDIVRKYANPETASLPYLMTNGMEGYQVANADPAYDANALVAERWRDKPRIQGEPSSYGFGYIEPPAVFQQERIDPPSMWFRPQPLPPPPLFR